MGGTPLPTTVRRALVAGVDGVIVTVDGIAVLVVAVGVVGLATGGTESALYALTIGAIYDAVTSPGLGTMDLLAYAVLAVVALGRAWHWLLEADGPTAGTPEDEGPEAGQDAFEFAPTPAGDAASGSRPPTDGGAYRTVLSADDGPGSSSWTTTLFDEPAATPAVPEGDFLRGPSESRDRPTDGAEQSVEPPSPLDGAGGQDEGSSGPAVVTDDRDDPADGAADASTDDGGDGAAGSEPPDASVEPTGRRGDRPEAPTDRLRDVVADARASVETVEDRVVLAAAGSVVERAVTTLVDSREEADAAVGEFRTAHDDRDGAVAGAVETVLADGRRMEAALDDLG